MKQIGKTMTTDLHELQNVLDETAGNMADILPDPGDWAAWLTYLLESLDSLAAERGLDRPGFEQTLLGLRDGLTVRVRDRQW